MGKITLLDISLWFLLISMIVVWMSGMIIYTLRRLPWIWSSHKLFLTISENSLFTTHRVFLLLDGNSPSAQVSQKSFSMCWISWSVIFFLLIAFVPVVTYRIDLCDSGTLYWRYFWYQIAIVTMKEHGHSLGLFETDVKIESVNLIFLDENVCFPVI